MRARSGAHLNPRKQQERQIYDAREERTPRVSAFVVLNRPSTFEDGAHIRRRFSDRSDDEAGRAVGGFHFTHELLLPDGSDCPWCAERGFLTGRIEHLQGEARQAAVTRRDRLIGRVEEPLLWGGGERVRPTFGSFFGELGPVAAFAAVSALGQHMHCTLESDRRDETIKVVDVPLLLQAFFDPVIVAGLLRTLAPRDLRDPASDPAVARTIRENAKNYPDATIAECALAATNGKVPARPVRELLEQRTGDWASALHALLEGY